MSSAPRNRRAPLVTSDVPTAAADAHDHVSFETAARHASSRIPILAPERTAAEARRQLVGQRYESASHVVVCRLGRFLGIVRLEDLLAAPEDATLEGLMDADAPRVAPGVDQEIAAWPCAG